MEIAKSNSGKSNAYILFAPSQQQKPFNIYFYDVFDRIHFCERISTLGNVTVKDQSDDQAANPHILRFTVLKINKMGIKRKRILYLDCMQNVIKSVNVKSAMKDTKIGDGRLTCIQESLEDPRACTLSFRDRSDWNFIFSDAHACQRFAVRCRAIANGEYRIGRGWVNPFRDVLAIRDRPESKSVPNMSRSVSSPAATQRKHNLGKGFYDTTLNNLSIFVGSWNVGSASAPKRTTVVDSDSADSLAARNASPSAIDRLDTTITALAGVLPAHPNAVNMSC